MIGKIKVSYREIRLGNLRLRELRKVEWLGPALAWMETSHQDVFPDSIIPLLYQPTYIGQFRVIAIERTDGEILLCRLNMYGIALDINHIVKRWASQAKRLLRKKKETRQ